MQMPKLIIFLNVKYDQVYSYIIQSMEMHVLKILEMLIYFQILKKAPLNKYYKIYT